MANDTFWTLLNSIVDKYIPKDVRRYQADSMQNDLSYAGTQNYTDLGYSPEKYGSNLTSQPGTYLHQNKYLGGKTPPTADSTLPFRVGGDTDLWGNIRINPDSSLKYKEISTLVHEMEHRRQLEYSHLRLEGNRDLLKEEPTKQEKKTVQSIVERFKRFSISPLTSRERHAISGQEEPDEIVAQLKAYEALLPAGMSIFQSPVGQKLFPDNQAKLWWLQKSRSDIGGTYTDQDYLEGLAKKEAERKGKK